MKRKVGRPKAYSRCYFPFTHKYHIGDLVSVINPITPTTWTGPYSARIIGLLVALTTTTELDPSLSMPMYRILFGTETKDIYESDIKGVIQ